MKHPHSALRPVNLPRNTFVTDVVRMGVIKIARHFEPYDDYVGTIDWANPQDRLELTTVLEADGAFSPSIFALVEDLGTRIFRMGEQMEQRDANRGRSTTEHRRRSRRLDAALDEIKFVLHKQHRLIAAMMVDEACRISLTRSVANFLNERGEEYTFNNIRTNVQNGMERECVGIIADWYLWASLNRGMQRATPSPFKSAADRTQAFAILKEIELEPKKVERGPRFVSPMHARASLKVEIFVPEDLDPLFIACFRAFSQDGNFQIGWGLSRITGELVPESGRFGSVRQAFEHYGLIDRYQILQDYCLHMLLRALLEGKLKERAFVVGQTASEAEPVNTAVEPVPTVPEITEDLPAPAAPIPLETLPQFERARRPEKELTEDGWWLLLRQTSLKYRQIINTFKRCEVGITYGGRHPKLDLGTWTSPLFNPHPKDPKQNFNLLKFTLQNLHIHPRVFYENIR